MKHLFVLVFLIGLTSCWNYSISNIGKYPTEAEQYGNWQKPNDKVEIVEIKKALLECNSPAPNPSDEQYKAIGYVNFDEQMNLRFLVYKCMEFSGYVDTGRYTVTDYCAWNKYKNLPACKPDAVIPTPSIERRLNSRYCRVKSDYDYCLTHALAPQLCSREKTNNPPPECLPD